MRLSRKLLFLAVCLALAASVSAGKKDDKAKEEKAKKDAKAEPGATPDPAVPAGPARISLPLEQGHPSRGLKIPYYDGAGALQMMFNIGQADRLDGDRVDMREMTVDTYNEEGEEEMTIDLPKSVFNLATHVITSATKTTIKREDFVIVGDSVEFDTLSKQGKLVGNVHMTIYNIKSVAPPEDDPKFAPAEENPR